MYRSLDGTAELSPLPASTQAVPGITKYGQLLARNPGQQLRLGTAAHVPESGHAVLFSLVSGLWEQVVSLGAVVFGRAGAGADGVKAGVAE